MSLRKTCVFSLLFSSAMLAFSSTSVTVTSPGNGTSLGSPVNYVASASTTCAGGISAMGIFTAPGVRAYKISANKLNTNINLPKGSYNTFVQAWDKCGGADKKSINITVSKINLARPKFLYATEYKAGKIAGYKVNSLTGSVTPTNQFEAWAHFGPVDIASDYWGNHLYVANAGSHDLSAYAIDRTTGKLTQISGSPYALVGSGGHVGMHPSGRFVYATTTTFKGGNYGIHAFVVQSNGSLVRVAGSPFGGSELANPSAIVVTKNYIYVSASGKGFGGIGAFSIDQTSGALTPVPGSPFPTPDGEVPDSLSTNATRNYLYANLSGADAIAGYAIDANTGILMHLPGSPYIEGTHNPNFPKGPYVVQVDPNGKFVFASDLFQPEFSVFKRDLNTGVLTFVNSYSWPGVCFPDNMNIDPSGTFLYTMASAGSFCGGPSTMLGFSLNQANGSLNSVLGPLFLNSNLFTGTIGEKVLVTR